MDEMDAEQIAAKKQELLDRFGIDNNEWLSAPVVIHESEVDPQDRPDMPNGYTLIDGFWVMTRVVEDEAIGQPVVEVRENPLGLAINLRGCVTRADVAAAVKKQWPSFLVRVERGKVSLLKEEGAPSRLLLITGKGPDWE